MVEGGIFKNVEAVRGKHIQRLSSVCSVLDLQQKGTLSSTLGVVDGINNNRDLHRYTHRMNVNFLFLRINPFFFLVIKNVRKS